MKTAEKILACSDDKNTEPAVLAFLGDSVTAGAFEDGAEDKKAVYHAVLGRMIKKQTGADVKVLNFGIGGENARQGLKRVGDIIASKPDLCVVAFGLNDAPGGLERLAEYENAVRDILTTLLDFGIEAIVMTPNMMNVKPADRSNPHYEFSLITSKIVSSGVQERYADAAKRAASSLFVPVADCFSIWKKLYESGVDTDAMLSNGVNHPTREAHKIFCEEIYRVLFS